MWGPVGQQVFHKTYTQVNRKQGVIIHPETTPLDSNQWKTLAWNVAWHAATATMDTQMELEVLS
jgi:hypothetical protein